MVDHAAFSPEISRRALVKGSVAAALGLGLASVMPEVLAPRVAEAAETGVFNVAIPSMPSTLLPSYSVGDDHTSEIRPLYESLFLELPSEELEYHLADSVEVSDDGLTYTVHIRDDANWSDGEPVVADDVMLAIAYLGRNSNGKSSSNVIDGVDVEFDQPDGKTLRITLPKVYNNYLHTMAGWVPMPAHVFGGDVAKVVEDGTYFITPGMATSGAYTVDQVNEDSLVYVARDDYYGGELQVKKVVMKTIGSGSTKLIALENGEIDYARVTTPEDLEKYAARGDEYTVYSMSECRLNYLQLNPNGPVVSQLPADARKALFLALSCQDIVDIAWGSDELAVPATSLLTPDQTIYSAEVKGYRQDLETARQLAESSGLAGQTLTYIYNSDRANMEQVAVVVQQQLAAIGVNLTIQGGDATTFFTQFFYGLWSGGEAFANTWDLASNGWDSMRGTTPCQAYSYFTQGATGYTTGFSDEVAALAEQANGTADAAECKELWAQIQQKALDECWEYPLTYTNYVMVARKNVKGLDCSPVVPEFARYQGITVE